MNRSLTRLDFSCNKITDEGSKALAAALRVNRASPKVFMHGNRLTAAGKMHADAFIAEASAITRACACMHGVEWCV